MAHLGLDSDPDRLGLVGRLVQVHSTDSIRMTHDRDSRSILNTLYQFVSSPGHD